VNENENESLDPAQEHPAALEEREMTRTELMRRAALAGAALSVPALLGNRDLVSGASAAPTQKVIEKLTFALSAPIRSLDFYHSFDSTTATVLSNGLEGLLRYGNDGRLIPCLAQSWSHPDSLTYVYKLRPGVKFWDGSPLTAADVVFSMSQHMLKKVGSELLSYYASVKSIKATGGNEVTIKLKTPDPFFQYVPAFQAGYIIQKKFAQAAGKKIGTPGVLTMGTGPYKFTKFVSDEGVSLVRNDEYWGTKGAIKKVELKFITEDATRLLAMQSGEIDGGFGVPADQADQWQRINGVKVLFTPQERTAFFTFDTEAAPWSDIHVRRAFAHAIDKQGLVRAVLRGHGEVAITYPAPQQWGGLLPQRKVRKLYASLPKYPFDLDKAKQELARSSVPNGFSATVVYPDSRKPIGQASLNLSQNLKQIGITLNVREATTSDWLNGLYAHKDLGIQVLTFGADYPDPANFPSLILDSKYAVPNAFNLANYKNSTVDRLLAKQAASSKPAERANLIKQILTIASKDVPYLPVWWQDIGLAIKRKYVYVGFSTWYYTQPWLTHIRAA
jgi:peptide/nickel transport system substrate-binding protein